MRFLPSDFEVPELLETNRFRIRPLTIHDLVKDYDAVMTSREHLWGQFGQAWGWPQEDLTLDQVLYGTVQRWLAERWPFTRVAWPGRELPWDEYDALPDR